METQVTNKRLERALKHINRLWIPANEDLFYKIKESLDRGAYDLGVSFLLDDLKKDFSLYTYCIRELSFLMQEEDIHYPLHEPVDFFEFAGINRIKKVFNIEVSQISEHSLSSMTKEQARQYEAVIISAATAELLSEKTHIDSEHAYFTALLRQLGLTLVMWNYPSVFKDAIAFKGEQDLHNVISEKLGFSPFMLALVMFEQWGISPKLNSIVESNDDDNCIVKLCKIGEALARANQPELYPSAERDWELARVEIKKTLGCEGISSLQNYVKEYCSEYRSLHPGLFKETVKINPGKRISSHFEVSLLNGNKYAEHCSVRLKKAFKDFYKKLPNSKSMHDAVSLLLKDVFTKTNFKGMCVYTVDVGSATLVPRLRIGDIEPALLRSVTFEGQGACTNPVSIAYNHEPPIRGYMRDREVSYVASRLSPRMGGGVLYVELSDLSFKDINAQYIMHFKALRQAFYDIFA